MAKVSRAEAGLRAPRTETGQPAPKKGKRERNFSLPAFLDSFSLNRRRRNAETARALAEVTRTAALREGERIGEAKGRRLGKAEGRLDTALEALGLAAEAELRGLHNGLQTGVDIGANFMLELADKDEIPAPERTPDGQPVKRRVHVEVIHVTPGFGDLPGYPGDLFGPGGLSDFPDFPDQTGSGRYQIV